MTELNGPELLPPTLRLILLSLCCMGLGPMEQT